MKWSNRGLKLKESCLAGERVEEESTESQPRGGGGQVDKLGECRPYIPRDLVHWICTEEAAVQLCPLEG